MNGDPYLEQTDKGDVMMIPARVNCNLKSRTLEEIVSRRRHELLSMRESLSQELDRNLQVMRFVALILLTIMGTINNTTTSQGTTIKFPGTIIKRKSQINSIIIFEFTCDLHAILQTSMLEIYFAHIMRKGTSKRPKSIIDL